MKTHMPNKLLINISLCFLIFLLINSACAKAMPDSTQSPLYPTSAVQENVGEENNTIITFSASEYEHTLYDPLIEEFNQQNPGITVQFAPLPEMDQAADGALSWYHMLASAGDTTLTFDFSTAGSGGGKFFRDLAPLIEMDPEFTPEDFWPGALDACGDQNGHIYGIPLLINISGIFYDDESFDTAGITHPAPGWTWDDFREKVAALSQDSGDGAHFGYVERSYLFTSILAPIVGAYLDRTGGEVDAQVLQSDLNWYLDLIENHAIESLRGAEEQDQRQQIWQDLFKGDNHPAMWPGSLSEFIPGAIISMESDNPFNGMAINEYGFAPFPVAKDGSGDSTSLAGLTCVSISAGSQNPRAAWEWLSFLSQQWLIRDRSAWEIMQVPSRPSVADQVGYWNNLPPNVVPGVQFALNHAWYGSMYPEAFDAVDTALTEAVRGTDFSAAYNNALAKLAPTPISTEDQSTIVVATPQAPVPAEARVINYYNDRFATYYSRTIKSLVDEFNRSHPDIFVKLSEFDSPPVNNDWFTYLADKYDCFSLFPISDRDNTNSILNLNSLFESEGPDFTQDYPRALLDEYRLDDNLMGLPVSSQPQIIAYNADLLSQLGLEEPTNDWTFDDFIRLATAASATVNGEQTFGFITYVDDTFLLEGQGIEFTGSSLQSARIDTPEMRSALTWLQELVKSGVVLIQGRDNWQKINNAVISGHVAFWKTMVDMPNEYFSPNNEEPGYKIKFAPIPAIRNENNAVITAITHANYISSKTMDPQACWTWIKFLSEQPGAFPGVPARLSTANSPGWTAQVGEQNANVYRFALSHITPTSELRNSDPILAPIISWINQAASAVLKGKTPQEAITESQAKADTYMFCIQPIETAGMNDEDILGEVMRCVEQADPDWRQ